ncbi:MAG: YdcF family protein [Bacillota bacterium]|nr:YdcF family protein [Bacillota bacterium]
MTVFKFTERKCRPGLVALCCAALLLLCLSFTAAGIIRYGERDEKIPSDVAIVLGAAVEDAFVSPVFRERINHGIWLYEEGYVEQLIFTGGFGEGSSISEAAAARQYALSKFVPAESILIEESSTITEENLENAKKIMDAHGLETAILVSDPLHMKRAMLMAKDHGIAAVPSPTPTTMYRSLKTRAAFLLREEFLYIGYSFVRLFR